MKLKFSHFKRSQKIFINVNRKNLLFFWLKNIINKEKEIEHLEKILVKKTLLSLKLLLK